MVSIKAAIFDMDGLLIDSEPFWRASHVSAVAKHGVAITEDDVRPMAGRRTDYVVRHWRETHALNVSNDELEADVVRSVVDNIKQNGKELPGVRYIMSLFEEHGIPMALASSSSPEIIEAVLEKLQLRSHFQITYSAKHEEFGKPHPAVFLTTAKKLTVKPSQCVVFEDALSGIRAAKAAGMKCIAVPEASSLKPEFESEADLVVSNLNQVHWASIDNLFAS